MHPHNIGSNVSDNKDRSWPKVKSNLLIVKVILLTISWSDNRHSLGRTAFSKSGDVMCWIRLRVLSVLQTVVRKYKYLVTSECKLHACNSGIHRNKRKPIRVDTEQAQPLTSRYCWKVDPLHTVCKLHLSRSYLSRVTVVTKYLFFPHLRVTGFYCNICNSILD